MAAVHLSRPQTVKAIKFLPGSTHTHAACPPSLSRCHLCQRGRQVRPLESALTCPHLYQQRLRQLNFQGETSVAYYLIQSCCKRIVRVARLFRSQSHLIFSQVASLNWSGMWGTRGQTFAKAFLAKKKLLYPVVIGRWRALI